MRGLYIHIPFCKKKCDYCDFVSFDNCSNLIDDYLYALEKESLFYKDLFGSFDTVYVGGGTPSLLSPEQIRKLTKTIKAVTNNRDIKEFSFEVNPESLSSEKAKALFDGGINRISMGLQSSKPELLKKLGRITSPQKFAQAFEILRNTGFKNINADLMTGLPEQSLNDFIKSLDFLFSYNPEHISFYPLEIHENTPLGKQNIEENPDAAADMYDYALKVFPGKGYYRYEISNFSKKGFESKHNINYWMQGEYLGLGIAAAAYINGTRRTNTNDIRYYINSLYQSVIPDFASIETLNKRDKMAEKIILGLRLADGIALDRDIFIEFKKEFSSGNVKNMIEFDGNIIRLKKDKMYLSGKVFLEFI